LGEGGEAQGEYSEDFVVFGVLWPPRRSTGSNARRSVNFGVHHRLRVPHLFIYQSSSPMHFTFDSLRA
jgi:hypothetical protein